MLKRLFGINSFNNRILVYQMGKVGSVSVQVSLRKKGLRTTHAHYLWMPDKGEYSTSKLGLIKEILEEDKHWYVISLVREPIARNISAFFQRIETYYKQWRNYEFKPDMTGAFLNNYEHYWPLVWFEIEMLPLFGVDVYSEEFDHDKGYHIYRRPKVDLLVLRTENIDSSIGDAIYDFIGLKGVKPHLANYTTNKTRIAQMYLDFKEMSKFPKQFVDWMYNSRYARHFYSENELSNLRNRWSHE
jgi:hypothetical protein